MPYLLLTILASLLIAVILKVNETRQGERLVVAGANYIVAAMLGIGLTGSTGAALSAGWLGLGMLIGIGFVAGFMVLMRAIQEHGIAIPTSIARLSMLVPVVGSIILFGERLDTLRFTGIALGVLAFIMLGLSRRSGPRQSRAMSHGYVLLAMLFLVIGLNDLGMKAVQQEGVAKEPFLLAVFVTAAVICWSIVAACRLPVRRRDVVLGCLLGIPNYLSTYFLILALHSLPAGVVFPIMSAGGVVAATVVGIVVWREMPNRTSLIGIIIAAVAVALLGLAT